MSGHETAGRESWLRGLALASVLAAGACAGHYPDLPTSEDYAQSCSEIIDAYVKADAGYRDRKMAANAANTSIAAGTVYTAVTSVITATGAVAGPGVIVVIGGLTLAHLKGDLGASKKASDRVKYQALAIRNGCTNSDSLQREAELRRSGNAPVASSTDTSSPSASIADTPVAAPVATASVADPSVAKE